MYTINFLIDSGCDYLSESGGLSINLVHYSIIHSLPNFEKY